MTFWYVFLNRPCSYEGVKKPEMVPQTYSISAFPPSNQALHLFSPNGNIFMVILSTVYTAVVTFSPASVLDTQLCFLYTFAYIPQS